MSPHQQHIAASQDIAASQHIAASHDAAASQDVAASYDAAAHAKKQAETDLLLCRMHHCEPAAPGHRRGITGSPYPQYGEPDWISAPFDENEKHRNEKEWLHACVQPFSL